MPNVADAADMAPNAAAGGAAARGVPTLGLRPRNPCHEVLGAKATTHGVLAHWVFMPR